MRADGANAGQLSSSFGASSGKSRRRRRRPLEDLGHGRLKRDRECVATPEYTILHPWLRKVKRRLDPVHNLDREQFLAFLL